MDVYNEVNEVTFVDHFIFYIHIQLHISFLHCLDQLSRLHMILKPFMLRRVKKDVENELSEKVSV